MVEARLDARAISALIVVVAIWVTVLAIHAAIPEAAVAVAGSVDLTVTAGAAVYFLAVRRGHLPRRAVWLVVAAGAIGARMLLASTAEMFAVVAVLELAVLGVIIVRARRAVRGWREARAGGAARLDALDRALVASGLPARVASIVASELAIVALACAGWRAPERRAAVFTSHRVNGWALYAGVFALLILVETPVTHIALTALGWPIAAWVATYLSIYSALWFVGDLHALRHGGVIVSDDALELHLGVRWRGRVAREHIERIERGEAPDRRSDFSILGANVVVYLDTPCTLRGLGGRLRTTRVVALSIDEPDRFLEVLGGG